MPTPASAADTQVDPNPATAPASAGDQNQDTDSQKLPSPFDPESSADHQIKDLIDGRERRKAAATAAAGAPSAEPPKQLGSLISNALKFRTKDAKDTKDKPATQSEGQPGQPAAQAQPGQDAADPAVAKDAKEKPVKPKRQVQPTPAQPALDPNRIAEAAAAAAATAAVSAVKGGAAATPEAALVSQMSDEERHDYEVAKFMADKYPHLKGAGEKFLDNFRRTEEYKRRWESANPGKQFDPEDEDHDAHFDTVQKPWKEYEYRKAERAMEFAEVEKEQKESTSKELKRLEQHTARLEMAPIVDDTVTNAFGALVQGFDEEVFKSIGEPKFWDNLAKSNPAAARHLAGSVKEMTPLIETIVHIDDPKARTPIDPSNPSHKRWIDHLISSEAKYVGAVDEATGKVFTTRAEYVRMNPAQQARHFYLTTEHLLQELVNNTLAEVKSRIDHDVARSEEFARARGWTPPSAGATASPVTNQQQAQPAPKPAPNAAKPVSPTSGSSTKNDVKDPSGGAGGSGVLAATSKILFGR